MYSAHANSNIYYICQVIFVTRQPSNIHTYIHTFTYLHIIHPDKHNNHAVAYLDNNESSSSSSVLHTLII